MTTIVVTPIELGDGEFAVSGERFHHLFRVKRLRAGESVRVVDGEGRARRGVVARVDRAHGVVALGGAEPSLEAALRVELLVAPPKPERAAWLVEKATEVGVAAIRFVATDRAARGDKTSFGAGQLARLRRIAVAAVEQCGRAVVPEVTGVHPLAERLAARVEGASRKAQIGKEGTAAVGSAVGGEVQPLVVLDASGSRGASVVAPFSGGPGLSILVGPEGGWSEEEIVLFERAGVPRWSLGDRVLRVETAAVVAAGIALAG